MSNEEQNKAKPEGCKASAVKRVVMCWGWINPDGSIQEETFPSSNHAIDKMSERLSISEVEEFPLDCIYKVGFRLACLERHLTISRILE